MVLPLLLALVSIMFIADLTAPPDLQGTNEERVSAYVLDIRDNGNWVCPTDAAGKLISKPPLYAWLAALCSYITGDVNSLSLRLPSVLSLYLTALTLYCFGRYCFGAWSGFFAALLFTMSPAVVSQFAGARYDMLFAAAVTGTAWAAFLSWRRGQKWIWFWLGAALATLAKGPFGLILGAAGLLAVVWEKQTTPSPRLQGSHGWGILLFLMLTAGWFALAYLEWGHALIERMLVGELVSHTVGGDEAGGGRQFYKPTLTFFTDFFPWSVLAALGFWRLWRYPSATPLERQGERFAFCWFALGLLALSLASHHRSRLIIPLLPAAALVGGRELARLLAYRGRVAQWRVAMVLIGVFLCGLVVYYQVIRPQRRDVRETQAFREAAQLSLSTNLPFVMHVDTPYAFQFFRGDMHPRITMNQAAQLLQGDRSIAVAVSNWDRLLARAPLSTNDVAFQWPLQGPASVRIVSNQKRLDDATRRVVVLGPVFVELTGVRLQSGRRGALEVEAGETAGALLLRNTGKRSQRMRVHVRRASEGRNYERLLAPGDTWQLEAVPGAPLPQ